MQINGFLRDLGVSDSQEAVPRARRHPLLLALVALVGAECALLVAATAFLIIELLVDTPTSLATALALTVLTVLAAVFLLILVVNILRGRAWTRGATITWQVLQIAVAVAASKACLRDRISGGRSCCHRSRLSCCFSRSP